MDGDAAADGLCGRRCAEHRRWWRGTSAASGRRRGFQTGLLWGIAATALCALAAWQRSFGLLVLGTVIAGYYQANASLYRFAAAEVVPAVVAREGHLLGAGRRHHRWRVRPEPGLGHARPAAATLHRRLPVAGWRGAAGAGAGQLHPVPADAHGRAGGRRPAAARDRAPAGVHHRRGRGRARLRRDEPADGGHADRHGAMRAPVLGRRAGAGMACAGHVRAELLHRPPDPPLRHAAGDDRGPAAQPRPASPLRCRAPT